MSKSEKSMSDEELIILKIEKDVFEFIKSQKYHLPNKFLDE